MTMPLQDQIATALELATQHRLAMRTDQAAELYHAVLRSAPGNEDAILGLAKTYLLAQDDAAAVPYLQQARAFDPRNADLLLALGYAHLSLGRRHAQTHWDHAIEVFQAALRIEPRSAPGLQGLGTAYLAKGHITEGLQASTEALIYAPDDVDILCDIGNCHRVLYDLEKAIACYTKVLEIEQGHAFALFGYGIILSDRGDIEPGLELIDRALAVQPQNSDFLFTKALILLSTGNYPEGWRLYEAGLASPDKRAANLVANIPIWNGAPVPGQRLVLLQEQGLGDAIQFLRYAALCKPRAGEIFVLCPPALERLFQTCPFIDKVFTAIRTSECDVQVPLLSLPHIFGTTLETVPANIPYFSGPAAATEHWAQKLALPASGLIVGLSWSGSLFVDDAHGARRARRRNLDLRQLLPLFDIPGLSFCSLQIGEPAEQIAALGLSDRLVDVMGDVKDMFDTAAIIQNLDLVITVDTSVAHLAGALGKPVWILSRFDACWRWLRNRPDSPWYPTARIFGQPKDGDWDSVIAAVTTSLKDRLVDIPAAK